MLDHEVLHPYRFGPPVLQGVPHHEFYLPFPSGVCVGGGAAPGRLTAQRFMIVQRGVRRDAPLDCPRGDGDRDGLRLPRYHTFHPGNALVRNADRDRLRFGVVGSVLHLLYVPGGIDEAQVHDPYVPPDPLDVLQEPEGERVVVSVGEQECILLARLKHVV